MAACVLFGAHHTKLEAWARAPVAAVAAIVINFLPTDLKKYKVANYTLST